MSSKKRKRSDWVSLWMVTRNITLADSAIGNEKVKFLIREEMETPDNHFAIKLGVSSFGFCEAFIEANEGFLKSKLFKFSTMKVFNIREDFTHFIHLYEKEIDNNKF